MSINIPDPEVDCWDYALKSNSYDKIWMARPLGATDTGVVITVSPNPMWRYLVVADTKEGLMEDIKSMQDKAASDAEPIEISVLEVLNAWRFLRYNGMNICVTECGDYSPTNPEAWPGGPMAPVRNGFAFMLVEKETGTPVSHTLRGSEQSMVIPYVEPTINKLINLISDEDGLNISAMDLFDKHWITAVNLLDLAMQHPVVAWSGRVLPVYAIMGINPNHSGDPEEIALGNLDSQNPLR